MAPQDKKPGTSPKAPVPAAAPASPEVATARQAVVDVSTENAELRADLARQKVLLETAAAQNQKLALALAEKNEVIEAERAVSSVEEADRIATEQIKEGVLSDDHLVARLKPYNPQEGDVLQTYGLAGKRYLASRGWYPVSEGEAEELRKKMQPPTGKVRESRRRAFDVMTFGEAKQLDYEERNASAIQQSKQIAINAPPSSPQRASRSTR